MRTRDEQRVRLEISEISPDAMTPRLSLYGGYVFTGVPPKPWASVTLDHILQRQSGTRLIRLRYHAERNVWATTNGRWYSPDRVARSFNYVTPVITKNSSESLAPLLQA